METASKLDVTLVVLVLYCIGTMRHHSKTSSMEKMPIGAQYVVNLTNGNVVRVHDNCHIRVLKPTGVREK